MTQDENDCSRRDDVHRRYVLQHVSAQGADGPIQLPHLSNSTVQQCIYAHGSE